MMLTRKQCANYDVCSAPLCPLDEYIELRIWYPDEEICNSKTYTKGRIFTKNQRRIAKKAKDPDTYYTYEMLNRKIRIYPGVVGVDPDKTLGMDFGEVEKEWMKKHPEITPEEMARMKKMAERLPKDRFLGRK